MHGKMVRHGESHLTACQANPLGKPAQGACGFDILRLLEEEQVTAAGCIFSGLLKPVNHSDPACKSVGSTDDAAVTRKSQHLGLACRWAA